MLGGVDGTPFYFSVLLVGPGAHADPAKTFFFLSVAIRFWIQLKWKLKGFN